MWLKISEDKNSLRFGLLYFSFSIIFIYLLFVLFKLQIKNHVKYENLKIEQNNYKIDENLNRGNIYTKRKDGELVPLATMKLWYKVVLVPKDVPIYYEDRLFEQLSKVVNLDREVYNKKISKKTDLYEELLEISPENAVLIEDMNLVGVKTFKFNKREYPMNEIGAKVVGFVGGGEGGFTGRAGLEKYYNDILSKTEKSKIDNFFSNLFIQKIDFEKGLSQDQDSNKDKGSQDIITTLEPNVMRYTYEFLQDLQNVRGAEIVSAIIMKVKTGEILAIESLPTYNPNKYNQYDSKNFINPNVQGVYELGSIVKPLTISVGIENKLISPESTFNDKGEVRMDGYTIKNFDEKVRGIVSMQTVLGQSLNTGVVYVMQLLGRDRFREGFFKFKLNEETGIDLPGELSNKVRNLESTKDIDYATVAFGQGIALTPISMIRSLSSIINEGKLVTPYIVSAKKYKNSNEIDIKPSQEKELSVSTETANTVKNMMIRIVDEDLAKGKYKDDQYKVGAKTGTAQLTKDKGGYYDDRFLHSYFTFFGEGDSELAVLVFQVNPKGSELSSVILTPYVDKLKNFLVNYYSMKPNRNI